MHSYSGTGGVEVVHYYSGTGGRGRSCILFPHVPLQPARARGEQGLVHGCEEANGQVLTDGHLGVVMLLRVAAFLLPISRAIPPHVNLFVSCPLVLVFISWTGVQEILLFSLCRSVPGWHYFVRRAEAVAEFISQVHWRHSLGSELHSSYFTITALHHIRTGPA